MTIERLLADGSRKPFGAGQQFTPKMLECIQSLTRELTICDLNNSLNGTTAVPLPIGWTKVAEATGDKSGRKISLYQTPDGKLAFEAAGRCAVSSRAIDDPVVHFVMTGEVR